MARAWNYPGKWPLALVVGLSLSSTSPVLPAEDAFEFFTEEARVITASRKEEPINRAPNIIYVVTAEEIKKNGLQNIGDVLNRLPGFFTSYRPLEPMIQVRGVAPNENNKITFMINGHRVNNVNQTTDLIWPTTLDNVKQVEVIVGPGSVLYGADSLVAIVNMITKDLEGQEVVSSIGQNRSYATTAMVGRQWNDKFKLFASGTYARSAGWPSEGFHRHSGEKIATEGDDSLTRTLGIVRPSHSFFAKATLDTWSLQGSILNQAIPEYSSDRPEFGSQSTRYNYVHAFVLRNDAKRTDKLTTTFIASVDEKRLVWSNESIRPGSDLDTHEKLYSGEYSAQWASGKHFIQSGLQASIAQWRHNYFLTNFTPLGDYQSTGTVQGLIDIKDVTTVGGFFSEEYQLNPQVSLVGAVRADNNTNAQSRRVFVSPRAAVIYTPQPNWVLKTMYNTATKFPNPWDSNANRLWNVNRGASPASFSPNGPAVQPERLTTYELQSIHYVSRLRVSINTYYQELKDFIGWTTSWTNMGDYEGRGVEFDLRYAWNTSVDSWLNGAWQDAEFKARESGDHGFLQSPEGKMNAVPSYTLNAGNNWKITKNLSLSNTARYFTDQTVRRYAVPSVPLSRAEWDAYLATPGVYTWAQVKHIVYFDAALVYEHLFIPNLDLRFSGKNILDNRKRVSLQFTNGDYQPQGRYLEATLYLKI